VPAVFMRGGTSKGVFFRGHDLPADRAARDRLFLAAMGSPDPYGRQLDGLGGGVSSLSKVAVIEPPSRPDADVDYTFGQVAVGEALVDHGGTCGNLASAVGPFALDEGLVHAAGAAAVVRIHAVNTGKIIVARFRLEEGRAAVAGDLATPGVAGTGSPIRLDFLDPGGPRLLPSGSTTDLFDAPGFAGVRASMVDAATPCVFVAAADLGLTGVEHPADLERNRPVMAALESIRAQAGVRMGRGATAEAVSQRSPGNPKVAVVGPPAIARLLNGVDAAEGAMDVSVRMISMGAPHRAVPLTGALCLAVAARIDGTVVARATRRDGAGVRVGTPSGVMPVEADVELADGWTARSASVHRTARRLMEGKILIPRPS
jgi:2-methylaconitate cis-trans-isomerase PrpF